jgi:hypothetical protein
MREGQNLLRARAPVQSGRKHSLPARLVVSLTSHRKRFPTLHLTLRCLLSQNIKADELVLWLGYEDAPSLPSEVFALKAHGLVVRECEDIGPFTKIIPSLKEFPDAFVVTADDDTYYPRDWLDHLVSEYIFDDEILCRRAHRILLDDGGLPLPYPEWDRDIEEKGFGPDIFPTGVGGVFYPPDVLPAETLDLSSIRRLCPRADDIWLYWMASLAGRRFRRVGPRIECLSWRGSDAAALFHDNLRAGGNDKQIQAMVGEYGMPPGLRAS